MFDQNVKFMNEIFYIKFCATTHKKTYCIKEILICENRFMRLFFLKLVASYIIVQTLRDALFCLQA